MSSRHKILIVDDDERNIRVLKRILDGDSIISSARSGEEALALITQFHPDLILLDIIMPGMDGYETCRRIRSDNRLSLIKIILVSGQGMVEERLKGYEAGADDYITKPFNNEELKAKVRVFLRLKRAEEVDRIKGDLITLFSHETKTPLSGIIGVSDLLREDPDLDERARESADLIFRSGGLLLDFVRKTSLLCELKSGIKLTPSDDSPMHHLRDAIAKTRDEAAKKNVTVSLQGDESIQVRADWEMIDTALGFILDNAIKFSPEERSVKVVTETNNGTCRIHITDEGEGIPPEWIDNVFDEFAIRDIMHHKKGQGLSLAISKHIMDLHGGAIEVDSSADHGATFTLSLPL
ncbi:MAG: hybrid sensor histidine kinase/response regulator [Deltaproteobacteria bacterium]|nr:hybrid sensor histidine kinase/response regulator [Deltaproteobacteria bacterium]